MPNNMTANINNEINANISSAEMTAYWRSQHSISKDKLSGKLATATGKEKAAEFIKQYNYPLIVRKVSARARFFLDSAVTLLNKEEYDSCISFASGFSLLTYLIQTEINNDLADIVFIDTDVKDIVEQRIQRVNKLDSSIVDSLRNIKSQILDLEEACRQGQHLKDIFPTCKLPLFLIEGVIYFLSASCVKWLFKEIATYQQAAVILDYWPEEGLEQSQCFANAVSNLRGFMREDIVSFFETDFWSENNFLKITSYFITRSNSDIKAIENTLAIENNTAAQLIDQNQFFPVNLFIGELNY
jgi:O-methyltransferase involved in polyketide biosynthesis